ncbi:MAG: hypothetical protein ACI92B_002496, partial [Marinobacter maritimus]
AWLLSIRHSSARTPMLKWTSPLEKMKEPDND